MGEGHGAGRLPAWPLLGREAIMTMQHANRPAIQAPARDDEAAATYKQIYVRLSDAPYAYGEVIDRERVIEYAADGTPIGVEFLRVDGCVGLAGIPRADQIARALRAHDVTVCP